MPHSSGGGSHRGGTRSSSSRSRSSGGGSHRGGSSGGGSGSYGRIVRQKEFTGSRTFEYTSRGKRHRIYSNEAITASELVSSSFFRTIMLSVPLILLTVLLFAYIGNSVVIPRKAIVHTEEFPFVVQDGVNVLGEGSELKEAVQSFRKKTGVVPAVYTVHNEEWNENYTSLENFALDIYMQNFQDEVHWVIVYSEPESPKKEFTDWYWEGIIGDDTANAVPQIYIDDFNENFQKNLLANGDNVDLALADALNELTASVKPFRVNLNSDTVQPILMILLIVSVLAYFTKKSLTSFFVLRNAEGFREIVGSNTPAVTETVEALCVECSYCGRLYGIKENENRCPHCGAVEYSFTELVQKKMRNNNRINESESETK